VLYQYFTPSVGVISVFICWKKKKSAWNAFPEVGVTDSFLQLFADADINDTVVSVLECFLIIMYDRTTDVDDLNSARRHFFIKRLKSLELLPPTSDAFFAAYPTSSLPMNAHLGPVTE